MKPNYAKLSDDHAAECGQWWDSEACYITREPHHYLSLR